MNKKVIIIGAGFSGLAAASSLASEGFDVKVLEKHDIAGGRARKFTENGFTFDMGPSWYWLPDVFERFFNRFGKTTSDYYELKRLDPSYQIYYSRDEVYHVPAQFEGICDLFEQVEPGSSKNLRKFIDEAEYKYNVGIRNLVYKPSRSLLEFVDWSIISGVFKLHVFQSFDQYIKKYFKDPRLYPLLSFPIIFLGATPKRTPALYNLMNYADMKLGTWYPMGGMFSAVEAMVKLAESLGVEFLYNRPADGFETDNGRITGVISRGEVMDADYVLATADYHHVEQQLLPKEQRRYSAEYWDSREMAPSSLLFYLGLDKKLEGLQHHNLLFDEDFYRHAEDIFEHPQWPEKPLLYSSVTSKTDDTVAPEGMENLVMLIPVASGLQDTVEIRERYYHLVLDRLKRITGHDIRDHVVYKRIYAQNDFARDYNAFKGNAYGLGNTLKQTAIMKPAINSKKVSNLFYAGQLTVPGPGVPPSIISGQVAANEITKKAEKSGFVKVA
ncbi:MAG: phytoene desaturase [Bacteroidales bacterium]|nr:phytoene desaturase [Bacteroidales bacterium]